MKKKGFTLIELLAVIVILAVIALIATPLIMNVINDARKNSFKDSAYGIIKAVELRVMKEMQDAEGSTPPYKVDVTGTAISYSGEKPTAGMALVDENGKTSLYMKNNSYCAYKEASSQDITVTTNPSDCDAGIDTIKNTNVTELDGSTKPVVPPAPTVGYTYEVNTDENETYLGILYLDPTDLSATCNAQLAAANKQGKDASGNATLTGTKSGCMRWFVFGDNGTPTTAILDHNTTALAIYDFDNKNGTAGNERETNQYEADWQLEQDISNWDSSLSARFPTAQEIASAGATSSWNASSSSSFYFSGSSSTRGKYWWLYTNLYYVVNYNGQGDDNATYAFKMNPSGEISTGSLVGYWTNTQKGNSGTNVWYVERPGYLDCWLGVTSTGYGVRPVISLSSLDLSN